METLLILIMILIIGVPGYYLRAVFYVEMPKKIGYPKFILLLAAFIFILGLIIYNLTIGRIDFLQAIIILAILESLPFIYLRKEIAADLRQIFNREK